MRPARLARRYPCARYVPISGAGISTNELARRLFVLAPGEPVRGYQSNVARTLRIQWEAAGLVEITPGPRGAKLMRRIQ